MNGYSRPSHPLDTSPPQCAAARASHGHGAGLPAPQASDELRQDDWLCCQTNADQSQFYPAAAGSGRTELTPLGQYRGAVFLEMLATGERSIEVEMVGDGGVDGYEFLQASHLSEAEHGPLSSPQRQVRILRPVVEMFCW